MTWTFDPLPDTGLGGDWLSEWMAASHLDGRRRHQALAVLQAGLAPLGVTSCVLVGGPWLEPASHGAQVWRLPAWPADRPAHAEPPDVGAARRAALAALRPLRPRLERGARGRQHRADLVRLRRRRHRRLVVRKRPAYTRA